MSVTYQSILEASKRIRGRVHETPVLESDFLNKLAGRRLFLKSEHLQKTGSFKARGALNSVLQLDSSIKAVCCDSSGNHGQALSWAAKQGGKECHVAVPEGAPEVKVAAIEAYSGQVHYCPPNDAGRESKRSELVSKFKAEMIHPSQDHRVISGQGTIGLELIDQIKDFDAIVIPIGGGGLISGIGIAIKHLNPKIKIIGAEPKQVDDCKQSFDAKQLLVTEKQFTVCDGVRTNVGPNTFPIISDIVDDIITLSDSEIAKSWIYLMERAKMVVEPTGALALAVALSDEFEMKYPRSKYKSVAVIVCGGNLDLSVVPKMIQLAK